MSHDHNLWTEMQPTVRGSRHSTQNIPLIKSRWNLANHRIVYSKLFPAMRRTYMYIIFIIEDYVILHVGVVFIWKQNLTVKPNQSSKMKSNKDIIYSVSSSTTLAVEWRCLCIRFLVYRKPYFRILRETTTNNQWPTLLIPLIMHGCHGESLSHSYVRSNSVLCL